MTPSALAAVRATKKNNMLVRLCRARDLLREPSERPLSIPEIAREAGLSPYHFIRVFKGFFGTTPHQTRIDARLEKARQLLLLGDYSVTEVCFAVGFSSLGRFSDLFARRVGVTPSAYGRAVQPRVQVPGPAPRQVVPGCFCLMRGWPE